MNLKTWIKNPWPMDHEAFLLWCRQMEAKHGVKFPRRVPKSTPRL